MKEGSKEERKEGSEEERKGGRVEIVWGGAGSSETGPPDERGWGVKRGNSLELRWKEQDRSAGRPTSVDAI